MFDSLLRKSIDWFDVCIDLNSMLPQIDDVWQRINSHLVTIWQQRQRLLHGFLDMPLGIHSFRVERFLLAKTEGSRFRPITIAAALQLSVTAVSCGCIWFLGFIHTYTPFLFARTFYRQNDRDRFSHLQRVRRELFHGIDQRPIIVRTNEWLLTAASLARNHRRGDKSFHCH